MKLPNLKVGVLGLIVTLFGVVGLFQAIKALYPVLVLFIIIGIVIELLLGRRGMF